MSKNDKAEFSVKDVLAAFGLLTRLPLRVPDHVFERGAAASWSFPVVGLGVAGLACFAGSLAAILGLHPFVQAFVCMVTLIMTTGALHEDGLADSADGLWGGWTPERRLEIMKDSQIGSYGVIALILVLGAQFWAVSGLWSHRDVWGVWSVWSAICAAAMLSRGVLPMMMHVMPNARPQGLSHAQGRPKRTTAVLSLALGSVGAIICLGLWTGLGMTVLMMAVAGGIGVLADHKIGGQTGDILGATQKLTEVSILLFLASAALS